MPDEEDSLEGQEPQDEPEDRMDWPGASPKQGAFLSAYVYTCGQVAPAARAARMARSIHYRWLETDPNYVQLFRSARMQAADYLEGIALKWAKEGTQEPVFYQGIKCGSVLRIHTGLIQFLLRGAMPDKYKERTEHSGPEGGPISINTKIDPNIAALTDDELSTALELVRKLAGPRGGTDAAAIQQSAPLLPE